MKPLPALAVLAAFSIGICARAQEKDGHPNLLGPIPPDPLMTDQVPVPHSAASLALRHMTETEGLFMWQLMKDTESLQPAQLRTLLHELLRVRRYRDMESPADIIVMEAWADRDLAAATADIVNISDWEDRDDNIGADDSDIEDFGEVLWSRLAEKDFAAAVKIADSVQGYETARRFFAWAAERAAFKAEQFPAFLELANRHTPHAKPEEMLPRAVREIFDRVGKEEAEKAVRLLPDGPAKTAAVKQLASLKSEEAGSGRPKPLVSASPVLTRLAALDCQDANGLRVPFPLFREVLKLPPAEALALGKQLAAEKLTTRWLAWMLFMRAAEGDALAAAEISAGITGFYSSMVSSAITAALTAAQPDAIERLRRMSPGGARDEAVSGFLTRADLAQADRWMALARELRTPPQSWFPLPLRIAARGDGSRALEIAARMPDNAAALYPIMQAWALQDFNGAKQFLLAAALKNKATPYSSGFKNAMLRLPPAVVLDALPAELLEPLTDSGTLEDSYWMYLAFEDPETGFRFMERIAGTSGSAVLPVRTFIHTVLRLQPERALRFVRKYKPESPGEAECFESIAAHWPDRVITIAEGTRNDGAWRTIGYTLAKHYPDRVKDLLKDVKNEAAHTGADAALSLKSSNQ